MVNFDGLKKELRETLHKMMMDETTAWLLRSLLKAKLATWDIYNFAAKQADLRTIIKTLDWRTMKSALQTKLSDVQSSLTYNRRKKSKLETQLKDCGKSGLNLK